MARPYQWHELKIRGDWVFNPGSRANQVARLAKRYVSRNLPEGSEVVTITAPDGAMTVLTYVPAQPTVVEHTPQAKAPEPRTEADKPQRTMSDAARQAANPSLNNKEYLDEERLRKTREADAKRLAEQKADERDDEDEESWITVDTGNEED